MTNSNLGYDCSNNISNCKFVPIFDEYKEIPFINRYHNIFDEKVSKFVTSDLLKSQIEEQYNDKLMKLDKEDEFYEIKLQTLKTLEALTNQRVKSLIDFDEEYSCSITLIAVEKSSKINLSTRFLNGKMLMFSKVYIKSFVYDLIDTFILPNAEIKEIYKKM